jgi:hypothetical protein
MAKKKPARKVDSNRPNPFAGVVEQANNERSPQWLVDKLEAAAKEILGKYSVEVDVSRNPMKPKYVTKSSAEWPFRLPKWPAGTKPKDIRQADDARDLMRHLRDLKSLLADRSDKTRDLTIAVAVMAGIKAGVMALGHIVEDAEQIRQKAGETREANLQREVEWFRIEYDSILADEKFRNETDRFSEINRRLVNAKKPKLSWSTFNRRRKDAGFSSRRDE